MKSPRPRDRWVDGRLASRAVLIGREIMLSAGDAAVSAAVGGRGRLVLVGGEAGIGKTALSMAIAERGVAAGMVLRIGACWEAEGLPPFTPWLEVLRRPGGDMASDVAMSLESGDPAVVTDADAARRARSRVFSEVVDALRLASEERPQLLLLEDLHWADVPSLELLAAVAAHLPSMAVLVVATFRDDELPRDNPLASIGGNAEHLNLEGLEVAGVAGLLDDVLHRPLAAGEAEAVMRQTAGNPLFVIQVARLIAVDSCRW